MVRHSVPAFLFVLLLAGAQGCSSNNEPDVRRLYPLPPAEGKHQTMPLVAHHQHRTSPALAELINSVQHEPSEQPFSAGQPVAMLEVRF